MEVFTVSFFGHRQIENLISLDNKLDVLISTLLKEKYFVEFLVGRNGEFDQAVSASIRRCKRLVRNDNSCHVWVLPYMTADLQNNGEHYLEYYDTIEVAAYKHYRSAFQSRNRKMVDRSNLVVFYVEKMFGGAYQTMQYAKKCNKPIVNLAARNTLSNDILESI